MVAVSSSESPLVPWLADWYTPMDLIRTLSGLAYQDAQTAEQSQFVAIRQSETALVEQVKADAMSNRRVDKSGLYEEAAKDLYESVVAELHDEENFLAHLLEGPADMKLSDEQALRQKVKVTLLDADASGCLQLALADLDQPWSANAEAFPQEVGQASARADIEKLRQNLCQILCDGVASGQLESALAQDDCERLEVAPTSPLSSALKAQKLSKARDALTKSKRPEVTDAEQLDLQAKTALLDASIYGNVHAKVTSPTKGKRRGSPKKGGS